MCNTAADNGFMADKAATAWRLASGGATAMVTGLYASVSKCTRLLARIFCKMFLIDGDCPVTVSFNVVFMRERHLFML